MSNDPTGRPWPSHLRDHVLAAIDIVRAHYETVGLKELGERRAVEARIRHYETEYSTDGLLAGFEQLTRTLLREMAELIGPGTDPATVLEEHIKHFRSIPVTDE
ncbi:MULTISPECIES: hypothetical protein [unclassified Mycobacterium]|uniref:hypothetical protein n=1 Tax=unclassified Mycobacterium TaxID=2642494 RepID=UPI0007FFA05B|nr:MULTISPECIES: hypothetical protein [unclassified Mycobacterium]OBG55781.1 hypothetical protein A5703_07485 [Mycobacterium sp. E188]OBH41083.1 hypothetical protein A5691_19340 [Mycobacterium sp. E183]